MVDNPTTTKQETNETHDWSKHEFKAPTKALSDPEHMQKFQTSNSYKNLMQYYVDLQQSITSKKISDTQENEKFATLVKFLEDCSKWIDEIPPVKQQMRFGNKSFRTWHDKMKENLNTYLDPVLKGINPDAINELSTYIHDSFGSYERLDYGTGHELAFAIFLYDLRELGVYGKEDYEGLVRNVFYRYIKLMRKIQLTYMLEPAGSHGVWGLDDHHFLPFLLGAAELVDNKDIKLPDYIHSQKILDDYSEEYMYLNCIQFIKNVKKGVPFHESSPMLNDISGAATWLKVANGMVKMYQVEVLNKFPVAKHIYFGTIFPFA